MPRGTIFLSPFIKGYIWIFDKKNSITMVWIECDLEIWSIFIFDPNSNIFMLKTYFLIILVTCHFNLAWFLKHKIYNEEGHLIIKIISVYYFMIQLYALYFHRIYNFYIKKKNLFT